MNSVGGGFYFRLRSYTKREQIYISMREGKKRVSHCVTLLIQQTIPTWATGLAAPQVGRESLLQRVQHTTNICNICLRITHPPTQQYGLFFAYVHVHLFLADSGKADTESHGRNPQLWKRNSYWWAQGSTHPHGTNNSSKEWLFQAQGRYVCISDTGLYWSGWQWISEFIFIKVIFKRFSI